MPRTSGSEMGDVFEGRVVADGGGQLAEGCREAVSGIGAGVDADLKRGDGEVLGEVGSGGDLAVGDDIGCHLRREILVLRRERSSTVPLSPPEDDFADVVLVFDEDEDAVEHVLEDGLGSRPMPTPRMPAEASRSW